MSDGNARHARFHEQGQAGQATSDAKRWCFVASAVYGETAPQTATLRAFRDQVLRKSSWGRAAIGAYYRCSPHIGLALMRRPTAARVVRWGLNLLIAALTLRKPQGGGR